MATNTLKSIPTWGEVLGELNSRITPSDEVQLFFCKKNGVLLDNDTDVSKINKEEIFGVAVVSNNVSCVIPTLDNLTFPSSAPTKFSYNTNILVNTAYENYETAIIDYNGYNNTLNQWNTYANPNDTTGVVSYVYQTIATSYFNKHCYIPSMGELSVIMPIWNSKIRPLFNKFNPNVPFSSGSQYIISSTEASPSRYWRYGSTNPTSTSTMAEKGNALTGSATFLLCPLEL